MHWRFAITHLSSRLELTTHNQILSDAAEGKLPNVSWLISLFDVSGHPPTSVCVGENWAIEVLNAIMAGPQWGSTAIFLMWDEWGGFYDHIEPPVWEAWEDGTPFRPGQRVPCLVISPHAKPGYISHAEYSSLSVLRFCEILFDLDPLNERDATADDMLDCFDFAQPPLPPIELTPRACA